MPLYRFARNDVFHNRIKTHPQCSFFIYSGSAYYNNRSNLSGAFVSSAPNVPSGHINLYELNVDRVSGSTELLNDGAEIKSPDIIYPFITKDSSLTDFKETRITSLGGVNVQHIDTLLPGDIITGSYSLSASISKEYLAGSHITRAISDMETAVDGETITPDTIDYGYPIKSKLGSKMSALKNTLDSYIYLSQHYAYSSASMAISDGEVVQWNKGDQEVGLVSIPSIFYGGRIQKGTLSLKFYITGTLVGELQDEKENGELVQVGPVGSNNSGSVAGVVLYNEGFLVLTGSWDLTEAETKFAPAHTENYIGPSATSPRWIDYAQTIATGSLSMPSSSFGLDFKGTNHVPTLTMLAHARKGHLNFSNNPTYIKHGQTRVSHTSSVKFREPQELEIKNIVSSSYQDFTASYKRQTYISKIGIYDAKRNLIGIAKVATPVKKTEERDFTFKLKLDF
tara:strand:+ start:898 stop:2256 length:1359 start_codon:yes stop_codon:yes gene_type:complete